MKSYILVILVLGCTVAVIPESTTHYYCGRQLAEAISVLCWPETKRSESLPAEVKRAGHYLPAGAKQGKFYLPAGEKHDEFYLPLGVKQPEFYLPKEEKHPEFYWPAENSLVLSGLRGKRGAVDECCLKPCSIDELMTYC